MPRPPKDDDGECVIKFRCSREVRACIEANAKAAGRTVSAFLRHIGQHGHIVSMEVAGAALEEVRRQGNNANQFARVANATGELRAEAAILALRDDLRTAWRALIEIMTGRRRT